MIICPFPFVFVIIRPLPLVFVIIRPLPLIFVIIRPLPLVNIWCVIVSSYPLLCYLSAKLSSAVLSECQVTLCCVIGVSSYSLLCYRSVKLPSAVLSVCQVTLCCVIGVSSYPPICYSVITKYTVSVCLLHVIIIIWRCPVGPEFCQVAIW